jgi:hypothetical protein
MAVVVARSAETAGLLFWRATLPANGAENAASLPSNSFAARREKSRPKSVYWLKAMCATPFAHMREDLAHMRGILAHMREPFAHVILAEWPCP